MLPGFPTDALSGSKLESMKLLKRAFVTSCLSEQSEEKRQSQAIFLKDSVYLELTTTFGWANAINSEI